MFHRIFMIARALGLMAMLAGVAGSSAAEDKTAAEAMRLLQRNCLGCHNPEKRKGGLDLSTRSAALKGGEDGVVLAPKKPEKSKLLKALAVEADPHMPPKKQLKAAEIDLVRKWISGGAAWDNAALAKASQPREVKIGALPADFQPVYALALTADGSKLAVGRQTEIQIFDLTSTNSAPVLKFAAANEFVRALAWSPDEKRLASGSFRELALWENGKALWKRNFKDGDRINALRFIATNNTLVVADGSRVRMIDVGTGAEQTNWVAHGDSINDLAVSRDGNLLATASADKLSRIWELPALKQVAQLEGHSGAVYGVAFNSNATELITVGADKLFAVWDVKSRESFATMPDRKRPLTCVAWPLTGTGALVTDDAGTVWSFSDFKRHTGAQSSEAAHERQLRDWKDEELHVIVASADGKRICVAGQTGVIRVLDEKGKETSKIDPPVAPALAWAITNSAPSFVNDVLPVMAKAGCMAGSCHAKPEGQNGFKLSVFSYDPKADYREITKEARGRRIFPAAPEESLLLLKPTATIEHGGGERFAVGSEPYQLLVRWIRSGMPYQRTNEATLVKISVEPGERVYKKKTLVPLAVTAHFSDGATRVVTALADYSSNDKEIATVDERGLVRASSLSGETVIVARYMGQVAAARVTIPADHQLAESKYAALPYNNYVDQLAYRRFRRLGIFPSELCADSEFLRRAMLDAIGRLPTLEETSEFLADSLPLKRQRWIERILNDPAYVDYWANKWADLLRPNPDRVGVKSIFVLDQWLRESFRANKPFDEFAREILTAEGSNHRDGPAVVYRDRREPQDRTTMFSQLFLGTRLECAKCHHHPNEKWSQDDFYQFAAFFDPIKQKGAGLSPPISAGTESFYYSGGPAEVKHPVTGEKMTPRPLDGPLVKSEKTDPRLELVDWLVNPKNPFFARAAVNRVWAVYFGRGFVEPVDDFRISNPIVNEPLLQALADDFAANHYDLKALMRTIMNSRLYQLSSTPNQYNLTDTKNFSRSYRRRLPAEVLLDAVNDVTGATDDFNGSPPETRAIQTWSYKVRSQFLDAFSRPNSSADCPCERDLKTSVVQSLHLMNAKGLQDKLASAKGRAKKLAEGKLNAYEIVTKLYLAAFAREPSASELEAAATAFSRPDASRQTATEDVLWALLNSPEFVFNH